MTLRGDLPSPRFINSWTDSYFSPVPWILCTGMCWGHPCHPTSLIIFKDSLRADDSGTQESVKRWDRVEHDQRMWNKTAALNTPIVSRRAATAEQISSHWKLQNKQATQTQFEMYWLHFNPQPSVAWNNDVRFKISHLANPKNHLWPSLWVPCPLLSLLALWPGELFSL